jgi:hypothetical protein
LSATTQAACAPLIGGGVTVGVGVGVGGAPLGAPLGAVLGAVLGFAVAEAVGDALETEVRIGATGRPELLLQAASITATAASEALDAVEKRLSMGRPPISKRRGFRNAILSRRTGS